MRRASRPIILMAFANPRRDLSNLKREASGIRKIFRNTRQCELMILDHPSLAEIEDVFQQYRNRIVIFHYAGHADGFQWMLESETGQTQSADIAGFGEFLASQRGLKFAFLNGCSTEGQVDDFFHAGIECVVATTRDIDDDLATEFALRFYQGLETGADLQMAFNEAAGSAKGSGGHAARGAVFGSQKTGTGKAWPWQIHSTTDRATQFTLQNEAAARRRTRSNVSVASQEQLETLLEKVDEAWIQGVLERTLHQSDPLRGSIESRPDAIHDPMEAIVEYPTSERKVMGADTGITEIFESVSKRLLILGQPGSGKTTAMLELTRDLVEQANRDPSLPVPVVFHLSTWSDPDQPLVDWLQEELSGKYQIPGRISHQWFLDYDLIVFLDGLDEVATEIQSRCVNAIHEFLDETGAPGMVVCCRFAEYSALPEKLRLGGAIHLQPLTTQQIYEYVDAGGTRLAFLRPVLAKHEPLRQLARSPLMLNIMSQAYSRSETEAIPETEFDSLESCRSHLFRRFIDRMFQQRSRAAPAFSRETTCRFLQWIARQNIREHSAIFLVENLQPGWLADAKQMRSYCLMVSVTLSVVLGIVAGLFWWGASWISADTRAAVEAGLIFWPFLLFGPWFLFACWLDHRMTGFVGRGDREGWKVFGQAFTKFSIYLVAWCVGMLLVPLVSGVDGMRAIAGPLLMTGVAGSMLLATPGRRHQAMLEIHAVEAIGWSTRKALCGALIGALGGFVVWIAFRWLWDEPNTRFYWQPDSPGKGQGFVFFLVGMVTIGVEVGVLTNGLVRSILKTRTQVNQGMLLSRRNGLLIGSVSGVLVLITVLVLSGIQNFEGTGRSFGACVWFAIGSGVSTMVCLGLMLGGFDFLKHWIVVGLLKRSGHIPKDLPAFLEHSTRLSFLKRVGGGFLFLHRLLQEHFASLDEMSKPGDRSD